MATQDSKKKTAEEGKNLKNKKSDPGTKKSASAKSSSKTKTTERSDVNSDVDQE